MDGLADVTVRPGRPDEVEVLRRLEVEAGARFAAVGMGYVAADEAAPPSWYLERIGDGRLHVAVEALPGGQERIVGYVAASTVDGEGHLDQVSVLESHTGRGIGARLVTEVVAWAAGRGDHGVTLTTYRDVPWNGPWYRRLGFQEVAPGDLGPELAAIRASERERGLDRDPRIAMRRPAGSGA